MRNLHIHQSFSYHLKEVADAVTFCCDSMGSVYIYSAGYIFKVKDSLVEELINIKSYYNREVPKLIDMNISSVSENFTLVFKNGDILNINRVSKVIECVGYVKNGLQTVSWSPDEAVVAFVTKTSSLILMTYMFDPIAEIDLNDKSFGDKQFVTVGWGKKETQFRGSEGKLKNTVDPTVVESNPVDSQKTEISWRGDSQLFAVNTTSENSSNRCIKIFTHDGILQYTSEPTCGLEGLVAWQPSGAIIASTQCLPNKYVVTFFEKNGLQHGDFTLPFLQNEKRVHHITWNNESTVLAVWWHNTAEIECGIFLFTRNNYHWYMKQAIDLKDKKLISLKWDSERKNRLHFIYISQGVMYKCYDLKWEVDHSRCRNSHVAVIDGDSILLTSFRHKVIPPPMCDQKIIMPAFVNQVLFPSYERDDVLFPSYERDDCFLAVLSDTSVARIVKTNEEWKMTHTFYHLDSQVRCLFNYEHALWVKENIFVNVHGKELTIWEIKDEENAIIVKDIVPLKCHVLTLTAISVKDCILIQFENGNLYMFNITDKMIRPYFCNMPEPCVKIDECEYRESVTLIGLSEKMRFYLNGNEVASNVTSYTLHSDFILFTTLQHKLYCALISTEDALKKLSAGRSVERGSRLVVAVPRDTRVVLQMPRGNLESIHPRFLCLRVIGSYLDSLEYERAFELLRKHRISLNLICDHDPNTFFLNVSYFVKCVKKQTWLSLFLSELVEEDVTQTMYSEFYSQLYRDHAIIENKVKRICEAVREAFLSLECSDTYLLPILTSHVRQQTKDELAAALSRIKSIKEEENNMSSEKKNLPVSSEEAMKHLLYLVDVNELYDVALGTYDFDLVLFVASKSQKDPKEYLPFLNGLRKLEPNYQKYTIDKYLKRYESALVHISHCCSDNIEILEEMLFFIKDHMLYKKALSLFDEKSQEYKEVATFYATYLEKNNFKFDAGIMFQRVNYLSAAVRCFSASGDWRLALIATSQDKYGLSDMQDFCRRLASRLAERSLFSDAAEILDQNLKDVEECVAMLVRGHLWAEAFSKSLFYNRADLVETHVKPGVEQHFEQLSSQISSGCTQFKSYKNRLVIIRRIQPTVLEDNKKAAVPDSDLFSDTSSVVRSNLSSSASRSSGRSRTSCKKKRKQERKLLSLKEGSPYEDLALIRALHELITNTAKLKEEVKSLCKMLLNFNKDTEARSLQQDYLSLMELMKSGVSEIWSPEVVNAQAQTVYGPESTVNSITANRQLEEMPAQKYALLEPKIRIPPVISSDTSWQLKILKD